MHASPPTDSREDQAMRDVGHTAISPILARVVTMLFLLVLVVPPLVDQVARYRKGDENALSAALHILPTTTEVAEQRTETGVVGTLAGINRQTLRRIQEYERDLGDNSVITKSLIPPVQQIVVGTLRAGTEGVYCGRDGWLFYRPGIDYLTGPGFLAPKVLAARMRAGNETVTPPRPNPLDAIVDFRDQLAKRGIALVVMPAPDKASVYPEYFSGRYTGNEVVQNPSYDALLAALRTADVIVCDPAPDLVEAKSVTKEPLFLATDTHWTPQGLAIAADSLANVLRDHDLVAPTPRHPYIRTTHTVVNQGDMVSMLSFPEDQSVYPRESVHTDRVESEDGTPWQPDPASEILLLGDSFSNIYTLDAMGWGAHAGLPAQLSAALQAPVDALLRNDAGAHATREELSRRMARGEDRLQGKRVVVWEFATRELAQGDWKTGLPLGIAEVSVADVVPGDEQRIHGIVTAVTRPPTPGSVPYKDCVVALHLQAVESNDDSSVPGEVVVYTPGMLDNTWTDATGYRVGQLIDVSVEAWTSVEATYGSLNRVDFNDPGVLLLPVYWTEANLPRDQERVVADTPETPVILHKPDTSPTEGESRIPLNRRSLEKDAPVREGKDGWLFFPPEIDQLATGYLWASDRPGPGDTAPNDPMAAIVDFHHQLADVGVQLVLLPIPPKAAIHAGALLDTNDLDVGVTAQRALESLETHYAQLRDAGVDVIDLAPLFQQGAQSGKPYYCKQDTHWNGQACVAVAAMLAEHLKTTTDLSGVPQRIYETEMGTVDMTGDLWRARDDATRSRESVTLEYVYERDGEARRVVAPWRESPVLLLSDSHGLVFHAGGDMHAVGAGLVDHLAKELGFPPDLVAVRGAGSTAPRIELLRRGDNLAGKKVVIWAFTAREFAHTPAGWPLVPVVRESAPFPKADTDNRRAAAIATARSNIEMRVAQHGGWDAWFASLRSFQEAIQTKTEPSTRILRGDNQWRYHGLLAEYLRLPLTPELQEAWNKQYGEVHPGQWIPHYDAAKEAIIHLSNQLRARGIDLIFVPVPQKAEVYPEFILPTVSDNTPVSPQRDRLMADLLDADVETLDVLPALQMLKSESMVPLYSKSDIHWRSNAVRAAAQAVAHRLRRYDFSHTAPTSYTRATEPRSVLIRPSLRDALGEETPVHEQEHDAVLEVLEADGTPYDYRDHDDAPILLIGDSFMMGGHGGGSFAAQLAEAIQSPVHGHYQRNGGQQAPAALAREGGALLSGRRVVVWYTVAGMLGRHWPAVDLPDAGGAVAPPKNLAPQAPPLPPFGDRVFAFNGLFRPRIAFAKDGTPRAGVAPVGEGFARYDNNGAMVLGDGAFVLEEGAAYAAKRLSGVNGFSLEIILEAFDTGTTPRTILGLTRCFTLREHAGIVELAIESNQGTIGVPLGGIVPLEKTHIIVSVIDGRLRSWTNGVAGVDVPIAASLASEPGATFVFGTPHDADGWRGKMYRFAMRTGVIDDQEAESRYETVRPWLDTQVGPPTLRIAATLVGKSTVPLPEDIAPYTENLAVFEYAVDTVSRGVYPIDRVYVAHWGVLNGNAVPWTRDVSLGTQVALDLSRVAAHPELNNLNISQDIVSEYTRPILFDANAHALGLPPIPSAADTPLELGYLGIDHPPEDAAPVTTDPVVAEARAADIARDLNHIERMAHSHGGWLAWLNALQPFRDSVRAACEPANALASDGALFLSQQGYLFQKTVVLPYFPDTWFDAVPGGTAPERVIRATQEWLADRGIDLIVVPVPPRFEVTPHTLTTPVPTDGLVSPQRLKFQYDLLRAGVETVDLLPAFIEHQRATGEHLSLQFDSHYTNAAVRLLANSLAHRLGRYGFRPPDPAANPYTRTPVEASLRVSPWRFLRPDSPIEIPKYETVASCEVHDRNGEPFAPDEASPILVIGDSYSYVYQETAGHLPAQLAQALGMPVDHVGIGAGGPKVPEALLTLGTERLAPKQVVIWVFTARYLTQPGWRNPFTATAPLK